MEIVLGSQSQEMLEALLENGMDVARLNFSHGSHEQHAENIAKLRAASLKVRTFGRRVHARQRAPGRRSAGHHH